MANLRFALVGCGNIGHRHAPLIAASGDFLACCDNDPGSAAKMAVDHGCTAYNELDVLLSNEPALDIAVICSPNYLHADQAISCLRAGLHVLCEKPMAISSADGQRMVEAASQAGRKLFVVQQNRYNPPVRFVKNLLNNGSLGKIHAFQVNCFWNRTALYYNSPWKGKQALDGGILYTQFSHFVDMLIWFLGQAVSTQAVTGTYLLKDVIELEDTGFALISMQNGAIGSFNYTVTSFRKNMEGSIALFGEKGTVKIGGQYLNTLEYFCVDGMEPPVLDSTTLANNYGFYEGSMSNHHLVYEQLLNALNDRPYNLVEGEEALKSVTMIEMLLYPGITAAM